MGGRGEVFTCKFSNDHSRGPNPDSWHGRKHQIKRVMCHQRRDLFINISPRTIKPVES